MAEAGLEVKNFKVKDAGLEGKNIMVMDDGLEGKNTKVKADVIKEEHLRLAGIIKGVHADLRKKYQTNSHDFETVWKEHCTNQSVLSEYADAMYHLAHDHWSQLPKTRIDWCRDTIVEYFCHDGMTKAVEKEQRRQKHMTQKLHISTTCSFSEETGDFSRLESKASTEQRSCCSEDKPIFVTLPIEGKIRILDVGSCFNPFGDYKDFLAVGIDISPANPSVQFCDFLHVETTRPLQVACDTLETYLKNLKSPVDKLPKCSFHVVVFSLLLEYFPSPYQRWICCQKAYELLMVNGLLLIVTPDSHKQHRNAPMIKSWKKAIEEIGFIRWRYIKLEHLHCMAFRKIQKEEETSLFVSEITPDMLYIPQDFHDVDEMESVFSCQYTEDDEKFFMESVGELPGFVDTDE